MHWDLWKLCDQILVFEKTSQFLFLTVTETKQKINQFYVNFISISLTLVP